MRRRADYAKLIRQTVPREQEAGRRFLEEHPHFDWERWRRDVLTGRYVSTEEEVCAHSILPPTADLIELLLGEIKKDKKPGDDDVTNEILIYAELEDVYAALIAEVLRVWKSHRRDSSDIARAGGGDDGDPRRARTAARGRPAQLKWHHWTFLTTGGRSRLARRREGIINGEPGRRHEAVRRN